MFKGFGFGNRTMMRNLPPAQPQQQQQQQEQQGNGANGSSMASSGQQNQVSSNGGMLSGLGQRLFGARAGLGGFRSFPAQRVSSGYDADSDDDNDSVSGDETDDERESAPTVDSGINGAPVANAGTANQSQSQSQSQTQSQSQSQSQVSVTMSPIGGPNAGSFARFLHNRGISHSYLQTRLPNGQTLASGMGRASETGSTGRGDSGLGSQVSTVDHSQRAQTDAANPAVRQSSPAQFVGVEEDQVDHGRLQQVMQQENQQPVQEGRYALPRICWDTTRRQTMRALTPEGVANLEQQNRVEELANLGNPMVGDPVGNPRTMMLLRDAQRQNAEEKKKS